MRQGVDPATYYFRTTPYFETSSKKHGWMNRICSIATGARSHAGAGLRGVSGAVGGPFLGIGEARARLA